jgi:hypothetical protein
MEHPLPITGRCLCGNVRLTINAQPLFARICWCRDCQAFGAGGPTANACFPVEAVEVTGDLADFASTADSGARMRRRFCPTCGVQVFSAAESRPHLVIVRAGVLDDPEVARPDQTIWTASAPSWACFSPDLPRVEGQPPPRA